MENQANRSDRRKLLLVFVPDVMIPVEENQGLFMNDNKERVQELTKE